MEMLKEKSGRVLLYYTVSVSSCILEFADDYMFSDGLKMKVTDDGIFYEVEGNVSKI